MSTGLFLAGSLPGQGGVGCSACLAMGQKPSPTGHSGPAQPACGVNQAPASQPSASLPEMSAWKQQQSDKRVAGCG